MFLYIKQESGEEGLIAVDRIILVEDDLHEPDAPAFRVNPPPGTKSAIVVEGGRRIWTTKTVEEIKSAIRAATVPGAGPITNV